MRFSDAVKDMLRRRVERIAPLFVSGRSFDVVAFNLVDDAYIVVFEGSDDAEYWFISRETVERIDCFGMAPASWHPGLFPKHWYDTRRRPRSVIHLLQDYYSYFGVTFVVTDVRRRYGGELAIFGFPVGDLGVSHLFLVDEEDRHDTHYFVL